MEGSVVSRDALEKDIQWAADLILPVYEKRNRAILTKYDEMASNAAFHVPDTILFSMERFRIESRYQPAINQYQAIIERWMRLLELVHDWIDAYTSFAPYDDRFSSLQGMEVTLRNIKFCKDCYPGFLQAREDIFHRYFSMKWDDLFVHESFQNERRARRCMYTDDYIAFLKEVYPHCKPFGMAPAELVAKAEALHAQKKVFIS
jgi:hypothetical protein